MSVISVVGLRVRNSTFSNTNGTAPSAGIDFEPNDRNDRLEDIELTDLTIYNNSGNGIDFATNGLGLHPTATPLAMTSFVVKNLLIDGGRGGGLYYDSVVGSGTLVVEGAVIRNTMLAGIMRLHVRKKGLRLVMDSGRRHPRGNLYKIAINLRVVKEIGHV